MILEPILIDIRVKIPLKDYDNCKLIYKTKTTNGKTIFIAKNKLGHRFFMSGDGNIKIYIKGLNKYFDVDDKKS